MSFFFVGSLQRRQRHYQQDPWPQARVDCEIRSKLVSVNESKTRLLPDGLKLCRKRKDGEATPARREASKRNIPGRGRANGLYSARALTCFLQKVKESICASLGHPRFCPHRKPIPLGKCREICGEETREFVIPLANAILRSRFKIFFLAFRLHPGLRQLTNPEIIPGAEIPIDNEIVPDS